MRSQVALGSIIMNKASGGDGISVELFHNPERRCCESAALSMPANLENPAVATGLEKVSFHGRLQSTGSQRHDVVSKQQHSRY